MITQHLANLPSACPIDSSSLESCISALKSSISALESSLKTTEGSSAGWERFGWRCAIVVGIGVLGEIAVLRSEYREDLQDWGRGIIHSPDKPPAWRFWFSIVATLFVVGGVFGEAGATAKIASINSDLRSKTSELRAKSDLLLAVTTEEAGDAETSAKIARGEADAAGVSAGRAQKKADEASKFADAANKLADDANKQTRATEAELNEEHNKRMELEKSLQPRQLSFIAYEDGTTNIDNLRQLAGLKVIVEAIPDFEARAAAADIVSILRKAGIVVIKTGITEEYVWEGVEVQRYLPLDTANDSDWALVRSQTNAEIIVEFLEDNDWVVMPESSKRGELDPDTIRIRVGYKPNPYLAGATLPDWAKPQSAPATIRETTPIPKNKKIKFLLRDFTPFPEPPKKPDK